MTSQSITVQVSYEIAKIRIASLLITAYEGGSNYWYRIDYNKSTEPAEVWVPEDGDTILYSRAVLWPLSVGGRMFITNSEGDEYQGYLDLESIERGFQLMNRKYPKHFTDFVNENEDATTADVFLQLCVFGELIYG